MLVSGLTAISAVFLLVGTLQGPKLSSAIVDTARVTEQAGQQLRLFANQPLAEVSVEQVTVTPRAEVSVVVHDDVLIVQFEQRLRWGTEYTVEVRDVPATSRDATATFTHRFTTAPAELVYLDRGADLDEILRAAVDGTGRGEVVHAAEGIQHIAVVENAIVVARDASEGTSMLELVSQAGDIEQVRVPAGVRVERLVAPPVGTLLGVVLTSVARPDGLGVQPEYSRTLAVVDLAGDGALTVVQGLDGEPIPTLFAQFLPDGATMIAHAVDQSVLRIDLTGEPLALPIGQLPTAYALSTDATRLTGADTSGGIVLDLATAVESRLNPSPVDGEFAFGGTAVLTRTELRVQKVALPHQATGEVATLLVADDGTGSSRVLFRTVDDRGSIGDLTVSANDQYVAIEVIPSVVYAQPDGRPVNGRATSVTTVIVDIESGAIVRTLEGFAPLW